MRFGQLDIDPRKNPAVLDTGTWEPASVWNTISAIDESYWSSVREAAREERRPPADARCTVYAGSLAEYRRSVFFLAGLDDGQHVLVELGTKDKDVTLGEAIGTRPLRGGNHLVAYSADAATIDRYVRLLRPDKGPKALGDVPRLGVGSRMSTAAWPGVWQAMNKGNFRANPIQNSVREVNLLEDVLTARPPRLNYMANFGRVEEGHTGSTFEGLWVAGVLEALKTDLSVVFGADADHITVRCRAGEIERARRVIEAARYYTFFTLDVSDLLDYSAMSVSSQASHQDCLINRIDQVKQHETVINHLHGCLNGQEYRLDEATPGQLTEKYGAALDAVERLYNYIEAVKNGDPFDLELSIDETPANIDTFTCLTTGSQLRFLVQELQRRQIAVTHIAPNFGIEKELDYRGRDGLAGLEKRVRELHDVSREFGIMLDCHSGDDLKPATRQAVGRATRGHIHFKVSPVLQVIFAGTMNDVAPEEFRFWWDDTLDYARREAQAGSDLAAECVRRYEAADNQRPSPEHAVFHYYNFATVGKRDQKGQFVHRDKFYDLPPDFYCEYQRRICRYLSDVAADVFDCA